MNNKKSCFKGGKIFDIIFYLLGRMETGFINDFYSDFCRMSNKVLAERIPPLKRREKHLQRNKNCIERNKGHEESFLVNSNNRKFCEQ